MKRKGITIWEQHLERFVLGAAVIFFIAFTALQFLSEPNSVDVPAAGMVSPGDIDDLLSEKATRLQARLAPGAEAAFTIDDPTPVLDRFEGGLDASISRSPTIAPSQRRVVLAPEFHAQTGVAYHVPEIAAPTNVVRDQTFDALEEFEVAAHPALAERFPDAPHDLAWVTPAALFDLKAVREEFQRAGTNESAIPANWYRNRIDVFDVRVEREEYVDGTWTNQVVLDPLPGRVSFREELGGTIDRATSGTLLAQLAEPGVQREILRPAFYDTLNDTWSAPNPRIGDEDEAVEGSEEEIKLRRLVRKILRETGKRDDLLEQLGDLGGSMGERDRGRDEEEASRPPRAPGGTGGAGGAGGAGGSGDRRGPPKEKRRAPGGGGFGLGSEGGASGPTGAQKQKQIDNLKKRIRAIDRRLASWENEAASLRTALGVDVDAAAAAAEEAQDEIVVWAHDMTVEAGKTYRYRFTVEVYNPFYAKKLNLLEDQHALADSITLSSTPSAWSAPKRVLPDRKVYITRAYGADARGKRGTLGLGQATAEVYRFYHGRWWVDSFAVQPGDRIGTVETMRDAEVDSIDFGTNWFVLDIVQDIGVDREAEERGLGARVVLQSMEDEAMTMTGDPRETERDLDREWLREAVESAEANTEVASSG
jgi:hypothetical protein